MAHCGEYALVDGVQILSCKKPPDHDGCHKDRLWTGPGHYFSVHWPVDTVSGLDWSDPVTEPRTPTGSRV